MGRQALVTAMFNSSMDHKATLKLPPVECDELSFVPFLPVGSGDGMDCGSTEGTYRLGPTASCCFELLG